MILVHYKNIETLEKLIQLKGITKDRAPQCSLEENPYQRLLKAKYKILSELQKDFCEKILGGAKMSKQRIRQMGKRIKTRLFGGIEMNLWKADQLKKQLKFLGESLEAEDLRAEVRRMLDLDCSYTNFSLYDHMIVSDRQALILWYQGKTANVEDRVIIQFLSGLYKWKSNAENYLQSGVDAGLYMERMD